MSQLRFQMSDPSLWWSDDGQHCICQICIEWFSLDELFVDANGDKWDVCKECGYRETYIAPIILFMTQGRRNNRSKVA